MAITYLFLLLSSESIDSFGNNTSLNRALEQDETSIISAAASAQSSKPHVVTPRNHASNKEPVNYANRYTSIIDSPLESLTAQTKRQQQQQQPNKPSPISKEIEDSLKNYFAYLNGINSASPNGTARATGGAGTKDTSKKYNTVNPNNYALIEKRRPKSPVVTAYTPKHIEPVFIQKSTGSSNESNGNKNNKFATVNPTDLKKKINDAFLLLSESQQQRHDRLELEQLKQRNRRSKVAADSDLLQLDTEIDSIVENISKAEDSKRQSVLVETTKAQNARAESFDRGSRDEIKTTEEIEKAADFSQSSDESMVRLAEDMRDIKQTEQQKQRESVSSTTPVPVRVSESSQEQTSGSNAVNGPTGENNRASQVTVTNDTDAVSTGSDGGQANPVHKIEIRLKTNELLMKNESVEASLVVDRDNNLVSSGVRFRGVAKFLEALV